MINWRKTSEELPVVDSRVLVAEIDEETEFTLYSGAFNLYDCWFGTNNRELDEAPGFYADTIGVYLESEGLFCPKGMPSGTLYCASGMRIEPDYWCYAHELNLPKK